MDILGIGLMLGFINPESSVITLLGKLFFRSEPTWEQRNKMLTLLWAVAVGLAVGGVCVAAILLQNARR
jgi:hypothetical protein